MTKTLTEQWREGTLEDGYYYIDYDTQQRIFEIEDGCATYQGLPAETYFLNDVCLIKVLAPVPSYEKVKEMSQKIERLEFDNEALEMAHSEGKEINAELVSKNDELVQKIHILNEQSIKQYNELCEEIKKNNILEKKLDIATKALKDIVKDYDINGPCEEDCVGEYMCYTAIKALKEMEGVK